MEEVIAELQSIRGVELKISFFRPDLRQVHSVAVHVAETLRRRFRRQQPERA